MNVLEILSNNTVKLSITIDGKPVEYQVVDNTVVINHDLFHGIHFLRVKTVNSGDRFDINNIKLDGVYIRGYIYLSWLETNNKKQRPSTSLWEPEQTWVLPFGNPLSVWFNEVANILPIPHFLLHDDLDKKYDLYFPESIEIDSKFPKLIKDFFKYDATFTAIKKSDAESMLHRPYRIIDPELVDPVLTESVYHEILNNIDYLYQNRAKNNMPVRNHDPLEDSDYHDNQWVVMNFTKSGPELLVDLTTFPRLTELLESFKLVDPTHGWVGVVPPGKYFSPHIDNDYSSHGKSRDRCNRVYVTLTPNSKSLLKLSSVGIVPNSAIVWNISEYHHGMINDSDLPRVQLSLLIDPDKNTHLFNE